MNAPKWQWVLAALAGLFMLSTFTTDDDQSIGDFPCHASTQITVDPDASFSEKMGQVFDARYGRKEQKPNCGDESGGDSP